MSSTVAGTPACLRALHRRRAGDGVNLEQAFLRGHTEAQREAVVAGATVNVQAVHATRPEAVVGHLHEGTHHRVRQTETHEADLPTMRVTREHEIRFALREMLESAGIVEQEEPQQAGLPRVRSGDA